MRSASAAVVRFVFARGIVGMTDASATSKPSIPRTRQSGSTTWPIAHVPAGWKYPLTVDRTYSSAATVPGTSLHGEELGERARRSEPPCELEPFEDRSLVGRIREEATLDVRELDRIRGAQREPAVRRRLHQEHHHVRLVVARLVARRDPGDEVEIPCLGRAAAARGLQQRVWREELPVAGPTLRVVS